MTRFVCRNYGSCEHADSRQVFDITPGLEPTCPQCGLEAVEAGDDRSAGVPGGPPRAWPRVALAATGALALAAAATLAALRLPGPEAAQTPPDAPVAIAAADGPAAPPQVVLVPEAPASVPARVVNLAAQSLVLEAVRQMQAGRFEQAAASLDLAAAEDPREVLVPYNRAVLQLKTGHRREALAQLELALQMGLADRQAIDRDPDLAPIASSAEYRALLGRYLPGSDS